MKYRWYKLREAIPRKLAWLLPAKVAYWATIRLAAYGTVGPYSNQVVPNLTVLEALDRWEAKS